LEHRLFFCGLQSWERFSRRLSDDQITARVTKLDDNATGRIPEEIVCIGNRVARFPMLPITVRNLNASASIAIVAAGWKNV
jgi:hypothetical protein